MSLWWRIGVPLESRLATAALERPVADDTDLKVENGSLP
jgi:hypothetical protein